MGNADYYYLTDYAADEGTIAGNTANYTVSKAGTKTLSKIFYLSISNDDSTDDLIVEFDNTLNPQITIKAGEVLTLNNLKISNVYLTNNNSGSIAYRVQMWGD